MQYSEPFPVRQKFTSGVAFVKRQGDHVHVGLTTDSIDPATGTIEPLLIARLVMPAGAAMALAEALCCTWGGSADWIEEIANTLPA